MDIEGEYRIPAAREAVWRALNDPQVLSRCIPGCECLESRSPSEFDARVAARIGPVKARFATRIELSDIDPPASYTISGEGQGGAAGFGRGSADVTLEEAGDGATVLRYQARLEVGGKLAQVGSRLLVGTTRKLAGEFFGRLSGLLGGVEEAAAGEGEEQCASS